MYSYWHSFLTLEHQSPVVLDGQIDTAFAVAVAVADENANDGDSEAGSSLRLPMMMQPAAG